MQTPSLFYFLHLVLNFLVFTAAACQALVSLENGARLLSLRAKLEERQTLGLSIDSPLLHGISATMGTCTS
jgi:hypothetical protein